MENAIVPQQSQLAMMREELDIKRAMLEFQKEEAQLMIDSGLLPPTIKTVPQYLALITYGKMLGVDAWTAIKHIHVINGSPEPDGQLKLALVYRSGLLESMKVENNGREATVTVKRVGRDPMSARFTMEQAENAGLTQKQVWKQYGPDMLAWKATVRVMKRAFPDVINGLAEPPPNKPLVVNEVIERPWNYQENKQPQLTNGNKERRMSDPPAPPQPIPSVEPDFSEAEVVPEDPPASAFTLVKNVRTEEIGPAHIEPTAKALRAQLDAMPEDEPADKPADEKPADPKGYLMDTTLHRNNLHSWAWRTLQMHQDMVALAFDIDPKAEGWKKALDEALAKTSRSDAEEILRAFSTSDQAKTEPTPAK